MYRGPRTGDFTCRDIVSLSVNGEDENCAGVYTGTFGLAVLRLGLDEHKVDK